jgi:hypothetical protein
MRKLEIQDAVVMQLAIREEINRSEEARYDHRLHGLLLVSSGRSCNEVGTLFGEAATTVQRWVAASKSPGLLGCVRASARAGLDRLTSEAGGASKPIFASRRRRSGCRPTSGMDQSSLSTCSATTGSPWA